MTNKKATEVPKESSTKYTKDEIRAKLERLCDCDRILSKSDIADFPDITNFVEEKVPYDGDACTDDLETEYLRLTHLLDLPKNTFSLTKIETNLPQCLKYGFRSGLTHISMLKFSPLTRGFQGPAVGVAAIATSYVMKPQCWNESVIDRVIEDGDTYYVESYKNIEIDDRRALTLLDFKKQLEVRNSHRIIIKIDDPICAGTFRSETAKEFHIAKALELFFKKYTAGVLMSPVLNIAIWKSSKYFNIFDGQARLENCEVADQDSDGAAKLFIVQNLSGVLFIILEKSNVKNEPFVLYGVTVLDVRKLSELPQEDSKSHGEPKRRPSGYTIHEQYRGVVQGTYHIHHPILPQEFKGRNHLLIAVAALIYSKLLSGSKWTKVMLDLIFNQSNIYLTDLVRVLGKTLDDKFEMTVRDLLCDVVLGVYTVKIKIEENVVPGQGKGKWTIDLGIREFFKNHSLGILEIKKVHFAIWKEKNKYYLLDPFACDSEGFRVNPQNPEEIERYKKAASCVTMNSSVNQLMETLLENTESKEKDPFIIHGLNVLYIKAGTANDGSDEKVVFREKNTNRRPPQPESPPSTVFDECMTVIDTLPRPRIEDVPVEEAVQYPEMMNQIEIFVDIFDDSKSSDEEEDDKKNDKTNDTCTYKSTLSFKLQDSYEELSEKEETISGYAIINPHRLLLRGTKNCLDESFHYLTRGRQGLLISLTALVEKKQSDVAQWNSNNIDQIIISGHKAYKRIALWILQGAEGDGFEGVTDVDSIQEDEEEQSNKCQKQEQSKKCQKEETDCKSKKTSDESCEEAEPHFKEEKFASVGLDCIDLTMLPKKMKLGQNIITFTYKMSIFQGEANPLANLGEALERYFEYYNKMILENKKLHYAVWKKDNKYFVFNPYGTDEDGWRNTIDPASLSVVDNINDLVNLFYGFLEFNCCYFSFHAVKFKIIQDDEQPNDETVSDIDEIEPFERYKTKFLPLTEEEVIEMSAVDKKEDEELEEEYAEEENIRQLRCKPIIPRCASDATKLTSASMKKSIFLFREPEEPEPPETPIRLNLSLVTGIVKIERFNKDQSNEEFIEVFYEKLKYKHPPPFVNPPKKNLCDLIDIKLASKSAHSLLSRFSVDSKLAIKEKTDFISSTVHDASIVLQDSDIAGESKLIKLPPKKYFYTKTLPSGLTPIRAIDEQFMRDKSVDEANEEECRRKKMAKDIVMVPKNVNDETMEPILPSLIPLGPSIKTPKFIHGLQTCPQKRNEKCKLSAKDKDDIIMKKLVCSTENLLFEMMFPDFKDECEETEKICQNIEIVEECVEKGPKTPPEPEACGFHPTESDDVGIINANTCLENRESIELAHYKSCFFSAILCILAKVNVNVDEFRGGFLDRFIVAANKIEEGAGKLRYKMCRWFRNFNILGVKCNVILKQIRYADPENYEPDRLSSIMKSFLKKHQTGIIVFRNISYAFWTANDMFYLFDPYSCNENGCASPDGSGCLMQICDFNVFLDRIIDNAGESCKKPYRLYTISIAHLEKKNKKAKKKCKKLKCKPPPEEPPSPCPPEPEPVESDTSLIELADWAREKTEFPPLDFNHPTFQSIKNFNASALEVEILENEITRPILTPIEKGGKRQRVYDRKFYPKTVHAEPMDLCVMAWAQIYDPPIWSVRTVEGLFQASKEYALDSVLVSQDTTIPYMTDNMLPEFNIANFSFRVAFAPLHCGKLYAKEGWNLAMVINKVFESPIYTGAIIVCEDSHIGIMKKGERYYAWWLVLRTKNFRIIASEDIEDYLKLIVKELNQPWETGFEVRIVTISYAKIIGPDCSDLEGLHESMMPSTSIPEIHRKYLNDYDIDAVFLPTDKSRAPVYINGTVALNERDRVTEPRVQRCYFTALYALILKRDIIQNPLPGMVDKILELADNTYKLFEEPKYHTEHIIKDLFLMDRVFDLRDCASHLTTLMDEKQNKKNFFTIVKKQLTQFFKKCSSGIIQFSNCCYGFWYSEATKCFYYLDPYQCDEKGMRVNTCGKSCLCIFSTMCEMIKQMCCNQFEETTGFFMHRIHIESVNSSSFEKFQEDPIWNYLDYHWSYRHIGIEKAPKGKKVKAPIVDVDMKKPRWKNYLIEVPNMIFSLWGTIGTFDNRFGKRGGKNQAAISIAIFAMRDFSHPSNWTTTILDSAVICGDQFYRASKKACPQCLNKFNLLECLRISPYTWNFDFENDICGILYGAKDRLNLNEALELAFSNSINLLFQCRKKIIAILETTDAYYAIDSSWTGPPLFTKNHGAIYSIRCKNINTLIYVIVKMLNTNQRIDFTITPVKVICKQETCQSSDSKSKTTRKKLLDKPVRSAPGLTMDHETLVCGSITVSDEDSYLCYSRNLKLGLARGAEFELSKKVSKAMKKLESAPCKKICKEKKKKPKPPCELEIDNIFETDHLYIKEIGSTSNTCLGFPRILNLATEGTEGTECQKLLCDRTKLIDVKTSFVCEETRDVFERYNEQMDKEVYKSYAHNLKPQKSKMSMMSYGDEGEDMEGEYF